MNLISEVARLKELEAEALLADRKNTTVRQLVVCAEETTAEIKRLREELARWQEIARDERAQIIQYHRGILHPLDRPTNFWGKMSKDEKQTCYDIAAKELDLQLA